MSTDLTSYPIIDYIPLPGNTKECLVVAKSASCEFKRFDTYLIGYASAGEQQLSLNRWCKGLEFESIKDALKHIELMMSQE